MVKYLNRIGDIYYLHQGKTKKGNPKYFFSKKEDGTLAETIPDRYEIYENPNAMVYLRKISPKIITDEEISIVENGVRNLSNLEHFKIDVKKNQIIIFLPDQDLKSFNKMFLNYPGVNKDKLEESFKNGLTYSPMMRFVLIDQERRDFRVDRWCYRGSIDDWIDLNYGSSRNLVEEYCRHLGRESFYELM